LSQSSFTKYSLDNTFDAFTTISGELLLVYSTKFKSIECFDIVKAKYIKTVLNAHNSLIIIIRHYCPFYLNKDLILSSSNNPDYTIKIWDIENWTCIINITKIYEKGNMLATCLHFDEYQKESYIFTSSDCGQIKIWDKDGKYLTTINKTENNETYFLDTYYDETEFKYSLISGEMKCVKSYDLNTHQLFRTYIDNNSYVEHLSAFVYKNTNITELVECEFYGFVRIWNFHSGNLIRKIEICKKIPLVSLCLWNTEFLLLKVSVDIIMKYVQLKK
jgi:WD40 repeat protein